MTPKVSTSVEPTAGSVLKDCTPLINNDLEAVVEDEEEEEEEEEEEAEVEEVWSEKSPQL